MTSYTSVSGISQLLDMTQWDEENLREQAITIAPAVCAWVNMQISRNVDFTEEELIGEPIIVLAANSFAVYTLLSTQLDSHRVEDISLAMRRLTDSKDYIRAYCFRNGITAVFDAVDLSISGTVSYGFAAGTDANCI